MWTCPIRPHPRKGWGLLLPLTLLSCGRLGPPASPVAPSLVAAATTAFDVDPYHGAAFPRPGAIAGGAEVVAVGHDLPAGRTRVALRLAAGAGSWRAMATLPGASAPLDLGPVPAAGAGGLVAIVIPNPGGASFALTLAPARAPAPRYRLAATAIVASASSSLAGYPPSRSVDANLATEWANGGYREAQASLTLDLGARQAVTQLRTKQAPLAGGAYYQLEASGDGAAFRVVSGPLRNTTWGLEARTLPAGTACRFLRLRFFNVATNPVTRFSVFENQVVGAPAPSASPTAGPTSAPSVAPSPAPSGTGQRLQEGFEGYTEGTEPATFVDPNDEGYAYDWMPRVRWRVTAVNGSKQYVHENLNNRALLSFPRYRGTALGRSNGLLPDRYFAEVKVTPIRSYTYNPVGDQGTQVFYLDPTTYVEVMIKNTVFEVWQAIDAVPFTSVGWKRLYVEDVTTAANQARWLGADVDLAAGTLVAYLDRSRRATVSSPLLTPRNHFLALRGAGNVVAHDELRIEPR